MATATIADLEALNARIENTPPGPERNRLIAQSDRLHDRYVAQEAEAARHGRPEERQQAALALQREKQAHEREMALLKAEQAREAATRRREEQEARADAAREKARQKAVESRQRHLQDFGERTYVGRGPSNQTRVADALVTAGVGALSAIWTATRAPSQQIWWGIGFMGLGAISMVESQPGTSLESGGAGMLGANAGVTLLGILGLVK